MDRKYVFPVTMMLVGLGLWIVLVILRLARFSPVLDWTWLAPVMCIASGLLILISGIACVSAGGPFVGVVVRLVALLGLAAYAHWEVSRTSAVIGQLVAAVGIVVVGVVSLTSQRTADDEK